LSAAGYRPGIISRGYQSQSSADSAPQLVDSASDVRMVGDEPVLIACRTACPVMVGRDRPAAARALLASQPTLNVIISDDGLQHYALGREIEIVLGDERGVGNGWLLPAGPLREPASRRRDFTVVNAASVQPAPATYQMQLIGVLAEQLCDRTRRMPLTSPLYVGPVGDPDQRRQASRVVAAAGIGNPERFFALLRATGLVFDTLPLPDHYPFIDNPFASESADVILITEKDAVKCATHPTLKNDTRIWVVPVTARLDAGLIESILEKLRGHSIA
ncbi:MAG: tetraacyldisaccharide 4'-kinase, partial [Herbaspirillum sp.]